MTDLPSGCHGYDTCAGHLSPELYAQEPWPTSLLFAWKSKPRFSGHSCEPKLSTFRLSRRCAVRGSRRVHSRASGRGGGFRDERRPCHCREVLPLGIRGQWIRQRTKSLQNLCSGIPAHPEGVELGQRTTKPRQRRGWSALASSAHPSEASLGADVLGVHIDIGSNFSADDAPLATALLPFGLRLGVWSRPTVPLRRCGCRLVTDASDAGPASKLRRTGAGLFS